MTAQRAIGISLLAAIAAHGVFVFVTNTHTISTNQNHYDARQYRELADSLNAGEGFVLTRGESRGPDLDRTPIYPLFVSLFGSGWNTVPLILAVQHAMVFVTAGLTWWWVRSRSGRPWAAALAFAFVALDLTTMTYASYLLTETLFTLLLTIAIVAWPLPGDRRPGARAGLSGIAWGLATLTRPITFYLAPLVLALAILAAFKRPAVLRHALVALICGGLVTGTWMARNHALSGSATLSTIEGENLLHYRAALVSLPPGKSVDEWRKELRKATREGDYDRTDPRQAAALDVEKKKKAVELILSHPFGIFRPLVLGFPRLYFSPNRTYLYNVLGIAHEEWDLGAVDGSPMSEHILSRETLYLGASAGYQVAILVAALLGVIIAVRERAAWAGVAAIVLCYFTVLSTGLETHARFRVPLVPLLAALAGFALSEMIARRFGASSRER